MFCSLVMRSLASRAALSAVLAMAAGMTAPIIDASGGTDSPVITLLIPVSQWSDGSAAVKR